MGGREIGTLRAGGGADEPADLEGQLATLGSLAAETGRGGSPEEIASRALAVLCGATGADGGLILSLEDGFELIGRHGVSDALTERIEATGEIGDRLAHALDRADAAVAVDVGDAPVSDGLRAALREDGLETVAFAGMRAGGRMTGVLGLGWRRPMAAGPSTAVLVHAATLVAAALARARLLARVERGLDLERRLTDRLGALVELTRLPAADDEETIAEFLLTRIAQLLGAVGGRVIEIAGGRLRTIATFGLAEGLDRIQERRAAADVPFIRRFEGGEAAFVEPVEAGGLSPEATSFARDAGYGSFAAIPIRGERRLDGALIGFFREPVDRVPIDDRMLEAIARVVDIAFANQRLRRVASATEVRYRTLFERSPDALLVCSAADIVLDANPRAAELFGDGLVGRNIAELAVVDADRMTDLDDVAEGRTARWTGTARRIDGTTFPAEFERTRIRIAGEDRRFTLVRDTTDRQRLQQELLQAQKMEAIGLLVAGVAHELNNPLASIVAFSHLIRTDPALPPELHEQADLLISESGRTRRIVQNLLDFARQRPPERTPTSVRDLVERVLALQSYSFGPGRIRAIVDVPDDLPAVALDRAQIQQVLINLTQNAAQAIRTRSERGTIRIAARETVGDDGVPLVRLAVTDDGPGIPEHLRSRLFVPFFTTKAPGEGTGLGLSVSFGILAAHGGALRYEPGPDGIGASFILELPVDRQAAAADTTRTVESTGAGAGPDDAPDARVARRRILVLDDEPPIREFLARILRRSGYEAVLAGDGPTALEIVRNDPPDAILCDQRMAGTTGTAFHDAVAGIDGGLARRFAFMSGDVLNPELRDYALERGIVLLAKPFDVEAIASTVAELLDT